MFAKEYHRETSEAFQIVRVQDCEAMLTAIRETSDHMVKAVNTQNSHNYIGSVPNIVALNWAQEWGVKLYSREWLAKTRHRLKHDPDWRSLRVGG